MVKVLCVGATGSVGREVVREANAHGLQVRALVRDKARAPKFPQGVELVVGDLTREETLADAVDGIDAVVFTHGSDGSKEEHQAVDYGGVRNVLLALKGRRVRIALMTAIGVTNNEGSYNQSTEAHAWKRRGERLVRASGNAYTIVRPGWFDYNKPDELKLVALQGDTRQSGTPADGAVSREQLAETLVRSLTESAAERKTFELVSAKGPRTTDFAGLLRPLVADRTTPVLDGVKDQDNMPSDREPPEVKRDLIEVQRLAPKP